MYKYALFCFCFSISFLFGEIRLLDSIQNVQLKSSNKIVSSGKMEKQGVEYFIQNQNKVPVFISIRATDKENIYDSFVPGQFSIQPGKEEHVGWVLQNDPYERADWGVDWNIEFGQPSEISTP